METLNIRTLQKYRPWLSGVGFTLVLLSSVFAIAAVTKIQRFNEFEATLDLSRLVQADMVRPMALVMIGLELAIAVGLLFSRTRRAALNLAGSLICLFMTYSIWRGMHAIPLPCNCFGALLTMRPWQSLLLNMVLLGLTTWLLVRLDREARGQASIRAASYSSIG
jgi:hypothetical protein